MLTFPAVIALMGVTRQGRTASNCAQWKMLASKSGCRFVKHRSGEPCYRYWMILVISPTWFVNVRQVFSSGNLQIRPSTVAAIWSAWSTSQAASGAKIAWNRGWICSQGDMDGGDSSRTISKAEAPPLPFSMCVARMEIKVKLATSINFNQLQITNPYCAVIFIPGITRFGQGETIQI